MTRDETIKKSLDPDSAAISRDALAKIVYTRLFDWYVHKYTSSFIVEKKISALTYLWLLFFPKVVN